MDSADPVESRRCKATNRKGERCHRLPIRGGAVCAMHGGKAPQVKASAEMRLAALVDPAIGRLQRLLKAKSEMVALLASKDVLDRNGFKPTDKTELSGPDGGPVKQSIEVRFVGTPNAGV